VKAKNQQPVLIAGGGIGGLAAALALARKGWRSVVLEQAPQFGEIGAGIQIAPNAWHALDALGVGALVKREAVFVDAPRRHPWLAPRRLQGPARADRPSNRLEGGGFRCG
jgi:2-polyprenyl-6-methoxyphenol hydroxylase-like FAD-dependent oxidoreductase